MSRLIVIAAATPNWSSSEIGSSPAASCHAVQCQAPMTEPAMNASSVISILVLPPPTVNSVPEAHPAPSCMPMPKTNAPKTTARLSG